MWCAVHSSALCSGMSSVGIFLLQSGQVWVRWGQREMATVIGHSSEISSPTVTSTQGMGILGDRVQRIAAVSNNTPYG